MLSPGAALLPLPFLRADTLAAAVSGCPDPAGWVEPLRMACARFEIATPLRLAAFVAEIGHESADFTRLSENLNYSVSGLCLTFPKRVTREMAERIGRKPSRPADERAIAEAVYGNRLGNVFPGEAYRYRGAGLLQLTGYDNHDSCAIYFGLPTSEVPDWLRTREGAALGAAWWWHSRNLNPLADRGEIDRISRTVNGGDNGLADRRARYLRALRAFGAQ